MCLIKYTKCFLFVSKCQLTLNTVKLNVAKENIKHMLVQKAVSPGKNLFFYK